MSNANKFLDRAYSLQSAQDAISLYDEWANSYDAHMTEMDYLSPQLVADVVPKYSNLNDPILDAGCGTGLVGVALSRHGAITIDGLDISPGMLKVAKETGIYRKLEVADLTKPLSIADASYGTVVCSGTLTHGHVGSEVLPEFIRVTKAGGLVAATVIGDLWESHGFKAEVDRLADEKLIEIVSVDNAEYRKAKGVYVRLVILRKISRD